MGKKIGIILIILIALLIRWIRIEGMQRQQGIVTDINLAPTGRIGRTTAEVPIVTFQYKNGKTYNSRKDIGAKFHNTYKIGDTVTVYFPKYQPEQAEIYSVMAYWLSLPFISIIILAIFIWLGISNLITIPHNKS